MSSEPILVVQQSPPLTVQKSAPKGVSRFIGREEELRRLMDAGGATRSCPVRAVYGMLGVGKSTLVAEAARNLVHDFDECLYIDLRASCPWPVHPYDAVAGLLRACGMDQGDVARDLAGLVEQWRVHVSGKRLLLILGDADEEQVEAIAPNSDDCLVLITSRKQLGGDLVDDFVFLDVPGPQEAARLFLALADRRPARTDAAAVAELVELCGRLPLALAVLANVLKQRRTWTIAKLRDDFVSRPGMVKGGDWARRVDQTLLFWYDQLPPESKYFLRRLALHPGVECDRYAAAALGGIPAEEADERLDHLYRGHLLTERAADRYRMHKLVRDHVYARALEVDPPEVRDAATARLLDLYEYTADMAGRHFDRRARPAGPVPAPAYGHPPLTSRADAAAWLRSECPNLLSCAEYAYEKGETAEYERVVRLAAAMAEFLRQRGPWDRGIALHDRAVASARASGDALGQARALFNKANLHFRRAERLPDYEAVDELLRAVLALCDETSRHPSPRADPETARIIEAEAHSLRGHAKWMTDDAGTEDQIRVALSAFRAAKDQLGEADVCKQLSDLLRMTRPEEAEALAKRAVELCSEMHDELGETNALDSLGLVELFKGEAASAEGQFRDCLARYRGLGSRIGEANSQLHLARALRLIGRYRLARDAACEGLAVYEELGVRQGQANALEVYSSVLRVTGQLSLAARHSKKAVEIYGELGESLGKAEALDGLGIALRLKGKYGEAAGHLEESAALYGRHRRPFGKAEALSHLGVVLRLTGEFERAAELLREALREFRQVHHPFGQANALQQLGTILRLTAHDRTDYKAADERFERAEEIFVRIGHPLGQANVKAGRALVKDALGDPAGAQRGLEDSLQRFRDLGDRLGQAEVLNHLGELLLSTSDPIGGLARHRSALRAARQVQSPLEQGRAHHGAAHCLLINGSEAEAAVDLRQAVRIFTDIRAFENHRIDRELAQLEGRLAERGH
ncbi:tetratricopeptide repeat protein [Streptomyces sp. NPDC046925]|uniref:tetratricopeptide repeat protein n=1 Tax=Streptomyces sp. NPDC046925 TaxID=3155375 RepID=UPI0033EBC9E7